MRTEVNNDDGDSSIKKGQCADEGNVAKDEYGDAKNNDYSDVVLSMTVDEFCCNVSAVSAKRVSIRVQLGFSSQVSKMGRGPGKGSCLNIKGSYCRVEATPSVFHRCVWHVFWDNNSV